MRELMFQPVGAGATTGHGPGADTDHLMSSGPPVPMLIDDSSDPDSFDEEAGGPGAAGRPDPRAAFRSLAHSLNLAMVHVPAGVSRDEVRTVRDAARSARERGPRPGQESLTAAAELVVTWSAAVDGARERLSAARHDGLTRVDEAERAAKALLGPVPRSARRGGTVLAAVLHDVRLPVPGPAMRVALSDFYAEFVDSTPDQYALDMFLAHHPWWGDRSATPRQSMDDVVGSAGFDPDTWLRHAGQLLELPADLETRAAEALASTPFPAASTHLEGDVANLVAVQVVLERWGRVAEGAASATARELRDELARVGAAAFESAHASEFVEARRRMDVLRGMADLVAVWVVDERHGGRPEGSARRLAARLRAGFGDAAFEDDHAQEFARARALLGNRHEEAARALGIQLAAVRAPEVAVHHRMVDVLAFQLHRTQRMRVLAEARAVTLAGHLQAAHDELHRHSSAVLDLLEQELRDDRNALGHLLTDRGGGEGREAKQNLITRLAGTYDTETASYADLVVDWLVDGMRLLRAPVTAESLGLVVTVGSLLHSGRLDWRSVTATPREVSALLKALPNAPEADRRRWRATGRERLRGPSSPSAREQARFDLVATVVGHRFFDHPQVNTVLGVAERLRAEFAALRQRFNHPEYVARARYDALVAEEIAADLDYFGGVADSTGESSTDSDGDESGDESGSDEIGAGEPSADEPGANESSADGSSADESGADEPGGGDPDDAEPESADEEPADAESEESEESDSASESTDEEARDRSEADYQTSARLALGLPREPGDLTSPEASAAAAGRARAYDELATVLADAMRTRRVRPDARFARMAFAQAWRATEQRRREFQRSANADGVAHVDVDVPADVAGDRLRAGHTGGSDGRILAYEAFLTAEARALAEHVPAGPSPRAVADAERAAAHALGAAPPPLPWRGPAPDDQRRIWRRTTERLTRAYLVRSAAQAEIDRLNSLMPATGWPSMPQARAMIEATELAARADTLGRRLRARFTELHGHDEATAIVSEFYLRHDDQLRTARETLRQATPETASTASELAVVMLGEQVPDTGLPGRGRISPADRRRLQEDVRTVVAGALVAENSARAEADAVHTGILDPAHVDTAWKAAEEFLVDAGLLLDWTAVGQLP